MTNRSTRGWGVGSRNRRAFLAGVGGVATTGVAGCLGGDGSDGTASGDLLSVPVKGDPDADVTIVAYEDFACPHCATYSLNVVPKLFSEYADPGVIRYEYRDFPIPVDKEASWSAACAARSVQAREGDDAFYEYAHGLYENQSQLGPSLYKQLADDMGLDGSTIRDEAINRKHEPTVEADRSRGADTGVRSTPTVIVDGQSVEPSYDAISTAIENAR